LPAALCLATGRHYRDAELCVKDDLLELTTIRAHRTFP
jgi:hypothetical protein